MSLIGIIQAIQDTVGAVTGIRAAPDYAPENLNGIFPFSVCFPDTGTYTDGPNGGSAVGAVGSYKALHNIRVQIHFGRTDLRASLAASIPYGDTIAKALLIDPQINNSCSTFDSVSYTFGPLLWGDIQTIGWDFTLTDVKEIGSTT